MVNGDEGDWELLYSDLRLAGMLLLAVVCVGRSSASMLALRSLSLPTRREDVTTPLTMALITATQ